MTYDTSNPFGFSNWNYYYDFGADGTGSDIEAGNLNVADIGDPTILVGITGDSAALTVGNGDHSHGGTGIFGQRECPVYGVGVLGSCATGVGAYGVSQSGLGVVGRAMGSTDLEKDPLETLAPHVGVFGHAVGGTGVRGHGGEGFSIPSPENETKPRPIGAVFSAGRLRDAQLPGATGLHEVGFDALAQMQLIPSQADTLPPDGRLGDLFVALRGDLPVRLFLCSKIDGGIPMWQMVQMDSTFIPSGSPI
ncbi:MAG TPA: hypothetical protein VF886_08150 [Roseiarcus sp.]